MGKPELPNSTSIPFILNTLLDEYDTTILSAFKLKQNLMSTHQALNPAIYQHDGLCRKICKLSKEAAAAKEALALLKPQIGATTANIPHPVNRI